jgi:hypothetical protein
MASGLSRQRVVVTRVVNSVLLSVLVINGNVVIVRSLMVASGCVRTPVKENNHEDSNQS